MKLSLRSTIILALLIFLGMVSVHAQTEIIAGWTFGTVTGEESPLADQGNPNNIGIQRINLLNATLSGYVAGSPGRAITSSGWNNFSQERYWFVQINTAGFENLTLSSKQQSSNTGPKDFHVQYSLNGTSWIDIPNGNVTVANNFTSGVLNRIPIPQEANNKPEVFIRWLNTSEISVSLSTIASGGTNRIDEIFIEGTAIDEEIIQNPDPVQAANLPYTQDFAGFNFPLNTPVLEFGNQSEWTFTGPILNYTGDFTNDNLTAGGFRGNNNVLAYQHTGTTGVLIKTLTLINNTGSTIRSLDISYLGRVGRASQGRSPAYTVLVNGTEITSLTYSTLNGEDQRVSATVTGLNIAPNQTFTISWNSERGGLSGASKVIGIADLSVKVTPQPEQILNYNFAGQPGNQQFTAPSSVSEGLTGLNFTRGSGINPASAANSISSNGWNDGENRYFSFGFTVAPGKLVDLSQLQIGTNSSNTGPRDMALVYSGDGFNTPLATWQHITNPNTNSVPFSNLEIDLSSLQNLSGEVEFRIISTSNVSANGGSISSTGTSRVTNYFSGSDTGGTRFIGLIKDGEGVIIPSITITPETLDFGNLAINADNPVLSYVLGATNLSGDLSVTAPERLGISKDGSNFSSSITFSSEELTSTVPVYVRFDNTVPGGFNAQIIHNTTGTLPVSLQVNANVFDPFNIIEDFNTICSVNLGPIAGGWNQISVLGDQTWSCTNFGRAGTTPTASAPFGVQINGFAGGAARLNEDWLISPSYDLTEFDFPLLQFWSRVAFSGPRMKLLVSTDYVDGDPNLATWTELADRFAQGDVWTSSGEINLAAFKAANVRIAFVYTSSPEANAARWTLDDFSLRNSQTAPAPFLTNTIGNVDYWHFGVIPIGSTSNEVRSFNFSLSDALENLSISAGVGFEFSKDGVNYAPAITFTPAEAASTNTVRVRFQPNSEGAFSSPINFKSGDIEVNRGYLTGATIERSNTLDVVTWNIEWFGSSNPNQGPTDINLQLQNVKKVIEDLNADIYAFQEITNLEKFYELVAALPAYRGFHSPAVSGGGTFEDAQKLTFLYKTATIDSVSTRVLLQGVQPEQLVGYPSTPDRFWASGRLPFLFEAKAKINGAEKKINFVNVHTRSNGGGESAANPRYAMRRYDVNVLKDSLDQYYADVPLVILGDYNDDLDETVADQSAPTVNTSETSFINFINDRANYIPVTKSLSLAGLRTFPTFENVIDHIMISNELEENWIVNSERIIAPFDLIPNYSSTTSDHIPVKLRFNLFCDIIPAQIFGTAEVCGTNNTAELMLVGGVYESILGWEISLDSGQTWEFVDESAGEEILRINNLNTSALFRAILDADSCVPVTTESFEVVARQLPQPVILFNKGLLSSIEGDYTYYWYKDQKLIATTTNNSIRVNGEGNYQVVIEDISGCQASSPIFRFPQQIQATSIRIYPNPTSSRVSVLMRNVQGPATVDLRTGTGLQVARQLTSAGYAEFDLSGMLKGIYLITITDSLGTTIVERLLVD
ncbi:T9SS-dependent choice-of-anchor J family protein [Cecembia rubra]|uniref:T9SS-dependent choice-of-anchor J family protein n=1 Tax=Cecembia rubra TaxID=1485585 RepID=UPI0027149901|nr:choice-of-anchor J domain-containing protein [Cecembia rubra]